MTPTLRIPLTASAPATYDAVGRLAVLVAYTPSQARDPAGTSTGGQFTSDSSDQSESQNDEVAKDLYRKMLNLPPGERAAFLAGLSNDQLTRLGKFASTGKEAKGPIADIKNAVGQAMKSRGLDVSTAGLKEKAAKMGKAAGKGKSGGGKSGGGSKGKSGGSSKKSSGGGKSSGSKSSGSRSKKSSSGSSSSSKKTATTAEKKTTPAKAPKTAPPPKAPPAVTPIGGRRSSGPPQTPPGKPRPQPVRASAAPRVVLAAAAPKPPRISLGRGEEP